jgi:hypothetical protein
MNRTIRRVSSSLRAMFSKSPTKNKREWLFVKLNKKTIEKTTTTTTILITTEHQTTTIITKKKKQQQQIKTKLPYCVVVVQLRAAFASVVSIKVPFFAEFPIFRCPTLWARRASVCPVVRCKLTKLNCFSIVDTCCVLFKNNNHQWNDYH